MSNSDSDADADRYRTLVSARRSDLAEQFDEENDQIKTSRKRRMESDGNLSETSSDSDDSGDEGTEENEEDDTETYKQGTSDNRFESYEPPTKKKMTAAEAMMARMGYVEGTGLGKTQQGIAEPVGLSTQRGRVGLGHDASKTVGRDWATTWDESVEDKTIEEFPLWHVATEEIRQFVVQNLANDDWMTIGKKKLKIEDETTFCEEKILLNMLKAKDVFDHLNDRELREARTRANPYETIGSAFFQNRAAMKTANMDRVFDWIFSEESEKNILRKNPLNTGDRLNIDREAELFYFADVCAGPGGFSEYMLWRKGYYNAKGFGFTLKGPDDFKLGKFTASSAHYFEPFYGTHGDGDVTKPDNIESLEEFISKGTDGKGVNLMMADGGFSVEGQENIQEILSKRLYLCQLLVSLCIVKEGGNFFCKLFDIFTPFSAGLVYLMHVCYDEISLHKPHTSRPANSERYIICKGHRREYSTIVKNYLKRLNRKLDRFAKDKSQSDITDCVPLQVMMDDDVFFRYLVTHNERMALRQTTYLDKYLAYAKNQGLIDQDQGKLRDDCLKYWLVPNRGRQKNRDQMRMNSALHVLSQYSTSMLSDEELNARPVPFKTDFLANPGTKQLKYAEWNCVLLSNRTPPRLLVATAQSVYIYNTHWQQEDHFELRIPAETVLLVELLDTYDRTAVSKSLPKAKPRLVRIIDAAVLNGDNIAHLSYENRMKIAKKFVHALNLVKKEVRVGYGNRERTVFPREIVVAEHFSPNQLISVRSKLERTRIQHLGAEMAFHTENGHVILVSGVRFTRLLQEGLQMGWSTKNHEMYSHAPGRESIPERCFESKNCCASFWDVCVQKKRRSQNVHAPPGQCFWSWQDSLETSYGLRTILEASQHPAGPTLESLADIVNYTDGICGKTIA